MAIYMNKVMLIGNVGKKPELKESKSGPVCRVSLATTRHWTDAQGQKQSETEWHNCTAFGRVAEIFAEYLDKGSQLMVEGRLRTREYTDAQGVKRYSTEVLVERQQFGSRGTSDGQPQRPSTKPVSAPAAKKSAPVNAADIDEDCPF